VSWLKYLWATLIGFVVTVAVATSSATLILWLDFSRYVEPVSHGLVLGIDLGIWYGILVVAVSLFVLVWRTLWPSPAAALPGGIFIGLFAGTFVGTTVGIHFYRRHQNSKPATTNSKPGH